MIVVVGTVDDCKTFVETLVVFRAVLAVVVRADDMCVVGVVISRSRVLAVDVLVGTYDVDEADVETIGVLGWSVTRIVDVEGAIVVSVDAIFFVCDFVVDGDTVVFADLIVDVVVECGSVLSTVTICVTLVFVGYK